MKVKNETHWDSRQLKRLACCVARKEALLTADGYKRLRIVFKYKTSRTGWCYGGYGYYGTGSYPGTAEIRLPRAIHKVSNLDVVQVAKILAHEIGHAVGLRHADMTGLRKYTWEQGWKELYAWAKDFPVGPKKSWTQVVSQCNVGVDGRDTPHQVTLQGLPQAEGAGREGPSYVAWASPAPSVRSHPSGDCKEGKREEEMTNLDAADLEVVQRIQEARSCTIARAKEVYRAQAKKLADPDNPGRAQIILENFQRGEKSEPVEPKQETKTMATPKSDVPKKAKKKKAKAPAAANGAAKPTIELAELAREVEAVPADGVKHVFTANLFGKKHAIFLAVINHDEQGAAARFAPPHLSEVRLDAVRDYAKKNELPMAVCIAVKVKGRADQGYAVPDDLFKKFSNKMSRGRVAMGMSVEARIAYREGGWDGVKFSEAKPEAAAA